MQLILIRHGEPETTESHGERAEPALTPRGHWQAQRMAAWLAVEPIAPIITRSRLRAQPTAVPLQESLGLSHEVIADFDEIDRRATIYAPFTVLRDRFPHVLEAVTQGDWESIGWDSPQVFRQRVVTAYEDLVARRPGERVAVACHGGVIGVIATHLLGLEDPWVFANPPFASFSRLIVHSDRPAQIVSLNETGHYDAHRERVVGPDGGTSE